MSAITATETFPLVRDSRTTGRAKSHAAVKNNHRFINHLITALMALITIYAVVVMVIPHLLGAVPIVIPDSAMQTALHAGDLAVIRPINANLTEINQLAVGDVITYRPVLTDPNLATQRIAAIERDNAQNVTAITTVGDANHAVSATVNSDQVIGKMLYAMPKLGFISEHAKELAAFAMLTTAIFLITHGVMRALFTPKATSK